MVAIPVGSLADELEANLQQLLFLTLNTLQCSVLRQRLLNGVQLRGKVCHQGFVQALMDLEVQGTPLHTFKCQWNLLRLGRMQTWPVSEAAAPAQGAL